MPTYFAEINPNTKEVLRVIVADQEFIDSGKVGDPACWVQTWMEGGAKKNYAGVGYTYEQTLEAFVRPKPYDSWTLDTQKADWKAPKEVPVDGKAYSWDEDKLDWVTKSAVVDVPVDDAEI